MEECDAKSSADAKSLLIAVLDFEFILRLSILMILLPITSRLNSYIQGTSIDIRKVRLNAELSIKTLEGCRGIQEFDLLWERVDKTCTEIENLLNSGMISVEFKKAKLPNRRPSRRYQALVGESAGYFIYTDEILS